MKHKKAIISAAAVILLGCAAIGVAVAKKGESLPPAETAPIDSPAENMQTVTESTAESTTIDFSDAEEFIVGLSDTEVTDDLKTELSALNAALDNYILTGECGDPALKERIEAKGGKVSGSVSAKTECLINNDVNSTSSKNKTAKQLGVEILSEEDFLEKYGIAEDI